MPRVTLVSQVVDLFKSKPPGTELTVVEIENSLVRNETVLCVTLSNLIKQGVLKRKKDWSKDLYVYWLIN